MITTEEIKKISDYLVLVFKDIFATKEDFKKLDTKISKIQTSLDEIAGITEHNKKEIPALGGRIDNVESWVKQATPKIDLEYKP